MSDLTDKQIIAGAWLDAEKHRPYLLDTGLLHDLTPGGGDWACKVPDGAICRSVFWRSTEVAHVNPSGDLDDTTEGQIAMALAASPVTDKSLRVILALADDSANLPLIRRIAETAVAHIEAPAPRVPEPDNEN